VGSGDVRGEVRRAARAGILLVVAGGIAGVLNLLFNVVVARRGGAANYGAIGSLLTVVTVVGIVATGFQYGIARQAAVSTKTATQLILPALRSVAPWATGALLLAALAWPLSGFLRIPSLAPVLLITAVAAASVFWAALSGLLVGLQRFRVIAGLGVGAALLRLSLGFLVGRGTAAVAVTLVISLIGLGASFLAGLLVLILGARSKGASSARPVADAIEARPGTARLLGAVIAGALWTVWGLPVLFARHLLHPAAAGDFAATQLLAGALIWGTGPLVTAFFPTIARLRARRAFVYGELATLVLALAGAAVLTLVGPILFQHLYGSSFGASRQVLAVLAISAITTACATFAAWSAMASRAHIGRVLIGLLTALGAEVAWDLVGAHSPTSLAAAPAVSLLVGGMAFAAASRRRASQRAETVVPAMDATALAAAPLRGER
jgi:O-antigen/teichoic acid export membrane protein